jgi:hypothetical protein
MFLIALLSALSLIPAAALSGFAMYDVSDTFTSPVLPFWQPYLANVVDANKALDARRHLREAWLRQARGIFMLR